MERLNQDSEWPKKNIGGIEISEKEKDEWPSDYFECSRPVFMMSGALAEERAVKHRLKFKENRDEKELVTYLLLASRNQLMETFGFRELTLLEIKSLVEISKSLVKEISDNILDESREPLVPAFEVIAHWLWDNYAIDWKWEKDQSYKERMEDENKVFSKVSAEEYLNRKQTFIDYVRKVRDKALLAEIK